MTKRSKKAPSELGTMRSVRRSFRVLEHFAQEQRPLSPSELARALNSPLSSMVDVLRCLATEGYLAFDSRSRRYYPTLRVGLLGEWLTTNPLDHASYQDVMRQLRDATLETIGIFWQNDSRMKCVAELQGTHAITVSLRPGDNLRLFASAVGTALLAKWTDAEIGKAYRRHDARGSDDPGRSLEDCLEAAADARMRGYAVGYDLVTDGLGAIAAACPASAGQWMVVSVAGVSSRIAKREAEFGKILLQTLNAA